MTNYRFEGCILHDAPQFNRCFDCGEVLDEEEHEDGVLFKTAGVHCKFWFHKHCPFIHSDEEGFDKAKDFEKCEWKTVDECAEKTSCEFEFKVI